MTISGQSHDSHPITVEIQIFSPDGHIVTLYQYIVPADAPDPATTFLGTAIGVGLEPSPIPPIVPGGTYRVVAVTSEGQSMSTTFQAPDCSQP
jgi:hypothetical protein